MPVPFLDLKAQYRSIKQEIDPAILAVLDSCAFASGPFVEAFENEAQHFLDCIRGKATPIVSGADGLIMVKILEAADESLRRKRSIKV